MRRRILLAVGVLLITVTRAHALPFQNGSFELAALNPPLGSFSTLAAGSTTITGWEVFQSSIDYINGYWEAAEGTHSIDLNGNAGAAGIRQTFDTALGTNYLVRFALAGNPDGLPTTKTVSVTSGGAPQVYTFSVAGASYSDMQWIYQDFSFTAAANSSTLSFLSQTEGPYFGPALDNVSVEAVPEPATMALFGTGLVTLILRRRLRHTRAV